MSVTMYSKKPVSFGLCPVRKPTLYICKNKGTDQLRDDSSLNQRLCLSTYRTSPNFKPLAIFCGCTARYMSETPKKDFLVTRFNFQQRGNSYISHKNQPSAERTEIRGPVSCTRSPVIWAYCKYKKVLPNFAWI